MVRLYAFALVTLLVLVTFADAGCGLFGRLRDRRAARRSGSCSAATVMVQAHSHANDCASGNCNSRRLFGRRR